jgi:hypothetical protein
MKTRSIKFESIPDWAIDQTQRCRHTIAPAFHLAGLFNRHCRLTADTQRKVFGLVFTGKCLVRVHDGGMNISRKVAFGTDFSDANLTWDRVEELMRANRRPEF